MKYKTYKLDYNLSVELCELFKGTFKAKHCIDNVEEVFKRHHELPGKLKNMKIVYGAMDCNIQELDPSCKKAFWVKHCFLLLKQGDETVIVDPTLVVNKTNVVAEYIIAKEFSWDEYREQLLKENLNPNFWKPLRNDYNNLIQYLNNKEAILIG